ncbi:hypothetical protein [Neomicrococcus lactis]
MSFKRPFWGCWSQAADFERRSHPIPAAIMVVLAATHATSATQIMTCPMSVMKSNPWTLQNFMLALAYIPSGKTMLQ